MGGGKGNKFNANKIRSCYIRWNQDRAGKVREPKVTYSE